MKSTGFRQHQGRTVKRFVATVRGRLWVSAGVLLLIIRGRAGVAEAQVYVANSLGSPGTVSVINSVTNTVVATIPVGALPQGVAITPNGQFVYVTNQNSGTMSKIDTSSNTVIATIPVGSSPKGVTVSPDGNSVFVVANGSLVRFSVSTNAPTGTFTLPIGEPVDVAITPNGQFAYVVDKSQNVCSLYPVNLATGEILNNSAQCPGLTGAVGGSFPRAVAVRPDGQFVYDTAFQDGALQVLRVADNFHPGGGCVSGSGPFGCSFGGPSGIALSSDSKFGFTANQNANNVAIFALDATTGLPSLPSHVSLPGKPNDLDVTPDGRFLYVTHEPNLVSVIDLMASPPAVVKTITVGSSPQGIAVSPLASGPPPPPPPTLSASLLASPGTVHIGETITVTMTVSNTGGSPAVGVSAQPSLSVTGSGTVAQTGGSNPGPTTIGPGGSQPFTYTYSATAAGGVTFMGSASGGGVSSNIATSNAVTIQSSPSPPALSISPGGLNFTSEVGLADPPPQVVQISNSGTGTLTWSATRSTVSGGNWLGIQPSTGSVPPTASISVTAATCGLPAASYNGSVVVSADGASGSPASIAVTLVVTPPATTPHSPWVRVCPDRPTYQTGDMLRLRVSLRQGASSNSGDAYLFAQVRGTATVVSLVLSGGLLLPQFSPAPVPLGTSFQVQNFTGEVFQWAFDGFEPAGNYEIKAILALPGSDPAVPSNQLAIGVGSFTFAR